MPNSLHVSIYGGEANRNTDFQSREAVTTSVAEHMDALKTMVTDQNVDRVALTAVIQSGNDIRVCEVGMLDDNDAGDYRTYSNNTHWRHTVEESANNTFGNIADAIALYDAEDGDNAHSVDIGTSPIGKFVTHDTPEVSDDASDDDDMGSDDD